MKIIDLLNKIAKGEEVPKKIHHQYYEYKWNCMDNDYQKRNGEMFLGNLNIQYHLNDEVEILDDEYIKEEREHKKQLLNKLAKNYDLEVVEKVEENENPLEDMIDESVFKEQNIELKLGDLITTISGNTFYLNKQALENYSKKENLKNKIMKVERYVNRECANVMSNNEWLLNTSRCYILETIYERKDILNEKEKEYISNVIKPFRDRVVYITKKQYIDTGNYHISYLIKDASIYTMPSFKDKNMYKGMELNKEYSLEDLGL